MQLVSRQASWSETVEVFHPKEDLIVVIGDSLINTFVDMFISRVLHQKASEGPFIGSVNVDIRCRKSGSLRKFLHTCRLNNLSEN